LKQENIQVGVKSLENWEYHTCLELIKVTNKNYLFL